MRRSKFNLSHYKLATMDMGYLVPIGLIEVLPGDTFRQATSALVRFSPMAAPVMHPIEVRIHHFFVPHRLVWSGWEDFITGGPDGNNADRPPTIAPHTVTKGSVYNYYGLPVGTVVADGEISLLPASGYQAIYNEFYRDEDLIPAIGPYANGLPQRISWEKDYFTSARPWTQKGDDIVLPFGESAPVVPDGPGATPTWTIAGQGGQVFGQQASSSPEVDWMSPPGSTGQAEWNEPKLIADLSEATGVSINDFRRAFALQRYAEARARYGSRYTEYLRYLGVRPSDARLQRPEYLGGARVAMNISEVLQTAPEGDPSARDYGVGDLYGHGVGAIRQRPYRRFFEEHGYVHSFMSIRPKTLYQDAVPRHWMKSSREEFWQKELMQIGQQEIWNAEVYSNAADKTGTFGYQDRYQEYKTQPSQVAGDFEDTLNYWHLARKFDDEPVLNQSFIECDPSKRIFNEQTQQSCWVMINHRISARRLVSKSGASRIL